jgi:hypothetical protein
MPIRAMYGRDVEFGRTELYNWEEGLFNVIKARTKGKHCMICGKEIKPGCYCLGIHYYKVCIQCAEQFCDNFLKSLALQKNKAEELKKLLIDKKGEYDKNNIANSL